MWPFRKLKFHIATFDPKPDITVYELARIVAGTGVFKDMSLIHPEDFESGGKNSDISRHFKIDHKVF